MLGRDVAIRAVVRSVGARSEDLRRLGAEVVEADLFDPDRVADALRGAPRFVYVPCFHPLLIRSAVAFTQAAQDAKLLGVFPSLSGEGRAAPVSNEDIARVAAAVLLAPERHDGMTYRPTGPAQLSGAEMARAVAGAVGYGVLPVKLPWWLFYKVAREQGVDPAEESSFRSYMDEMQRGPFALDGGVTTGVLDVTGTPAECFETTACRYAALPFARQTLARRIAASARFNAAPFYPGIDPAAWERRHDLPKPPHPTLAIDDERWLAHHRHQMTRHKMLDPHQHPRCLTPCRQRQGRSSRL